MATRWEVTKAVRASELAAPSRLIMLVLADVAEVGTAEIPAKFSPSLRVLAAETGLDRSTVKRHLANLELAGWIVRTRPDASAQWFGERNRYRLDLPEGVGAQDAHLGAENTQGGGTEHPGVGAENSTGGRTVRPLETDHPDRSQTKVRSSAIETRRDDVEEICSHLADKIVGNGSKRPRITDRWRDSARLLLDKDGRTVEQVKRCIDWCQADEFWRANILSMPKLRQKYEQLRLSARRDNGHRPKASTTDERVRQALSLGAAPAVNEQKAIGS